MHLTKSLLKLIACGSLITLLSGCASVICGPKQTVAIDTKPHGAEVFVYDSHCDVVFQNTTPCVAKLARRTADYEGANYVILIKKEGFVPVQIPLTGEVNKAFFANILFGGLGMVVDPITGGMWTLSPDVIDPKVISENNPAVQEGGLLVSLRQDTSAPDIAQESKPAAIDFSKYLQQAPPVVAQETTPAAPEVVQEPTTPAAPETVQQPATPAAPEAAQQTTPAAPETVQDTKAAAPQAKPASPEAEQQKEASPDVAKQDKPNEK